MRLKMLRHVESRFTETLHVGWKNLFKMERFYYSRFWVGWCFPLKLAAHLPTHRFRDFSASTFALPWSVRIGSTAQNRLPQRNTCRQVDLKTVSNSLFSLNDFMLGGAPNPLLPKVFHRGGTTAGIKATS